MTDPVDTIPNAEWCSSAIYERNERIPGHISVFLIMQSFFPSAFSRRHKRRLSFFSFLSFLSLRKERQRRKTKSGMMKGQPQYSAGVKRTMNSHEFAGINRKDRMFYVW